MKIIIKKSVTAVSIDFTAISANSLLLFNYANKKGETNNYKFILPIDNIVFQKNIKNIFLKNVANGNKSSKFSL